MQNSEALIYLIKRGISPHASNLDYAVPINSEITSQRLQCSGRIISRLEIIFPIRINEAPVGRLYDKNGNFVEEIKFGISVTNPSRATWIADVNIKLDSIRLELELTRDCNIVLYTKY